MGKLTRNLVPDDHKWNVDDIMKEAEIESYFETIRELKNQLTSYKNKINCDNAIDYLLIDSKLSHLLEKVYVYVHLKSDEDKSVAKYLELCEKVSYLAVEISEETSFFTPTLASFKPSELKSMLNNPKYSDYSVFLDSLIRNKKHLLSKKEEQLLSGIGSFSGDFHNIFTMFDNVDINMGEIEVDGETIALTHGSYSQCMQNSSSEVRKEAFEKMYNSFKAMINTLASNYSGNVKQNYYFSKVRKYKSCLERALEVEQVPTIVYNNLVESVKKYTPLMHKYVGLRKKVLGLEEMHMYDIYTPIVKECYKNTNFGDAYDMVCEALSPLGQKYVDKLIEARKSGWIDVEETDSKKSGAYSWGVYGTHPYCLLNHKGTMHDIFTIAHEMGHSMHTYYSNLSQCYEKSGYCIFLAEIASTVNEVLMIKYMLKNTTGNERIYLLSYYIDMIRTTLFRQTMFAEFEKFSHESIENGQPLSAEYLSNHYHSLNKTYYGDEIINDDLIKYEWARIPHFYRDFYVYKYATGITSAINIANGILDGSIKVEDYIKFLSAGCSKPPLEILNYVGVDLTKKQPYTVAMKDFDATLQELNKLVKG